MEELSHIGSICILAGAVYNEGGRIVCKAYSALLALYCLTAVDGKSLAVKIDNDISLNVEVLCNGIAFNPLNVLEQVYGNVFKGVVAGECIYQIGWEKETRNASFTSTTPVAMP